MSYILEALKKNQADQEADPLTLNSASPSTRRGVSTSWVWLLSGLLLINLAFLGWYVFDSRPSGPEPEIAQRLPERSQTVTLKPEPVAPAIARPASEPTRVASGPEPSPAQAEVNRTPAPIETTPAPRITPSPRPAAPRNVPTVNAADLPSGERTLFDGLRFTSHIYTDDPALCAIVVNGKRLSVGDEVEGLTLHSVTETGAIFTQTWQGSARRVSVSPFE